MNINEIIQYRLTDWDTLSEIGCDIDVRIEAIPFRPENFRDENPLVWEIKRNGVRIEES